MSARKAALQAFDHDARILEAQIDDEPAWLLMRKMSYKPLTDQ